MPPVRASRKDLLGHLTRSVMQWTLPDILAALLAAVPLLLLLAGILPWSWAVALSALLAGLYLLLRRILVRRAERALVSYRGLLDTSLRVVLDDHPIHMVLLREDGVVLAANQAFLSFCGRSDLLGRRLPDLIPGFLQEWVTATEGESRRVVLRDRSFDLVVRVVRIRPNRGPVPFIDRQQRILALTMTDVTELVRRIDDLDSRMAMAGILLVDNYEDLMRETDEEMRPQVMLAVDRTIREWAGASGGIVSRMDRDRYLVLLERKALRDAESRRFDILDRIRGVKEGNRIPPTLSVGVGVDGDTPAERMRNAQNCLDIALGRGGDQVVMLRGQTHLFYGGRTQAVEKHNRVRSRVMAQALEEAMGKSRRIYVMGHRGPDMDSFGACVGIARLAAAQDRESAVLLGRYGEAVRPFLDLLADRGRIRFLSPEDAMAEAGPEDMAVVVDTMRPGQVLEPGLLGRCGRVAALDHHRKSADYIREATLSLVEPYASSTCELVAEILYHAAAEVDLSPDEADTLFAGIHVDTKGFTTRTGVRTFEAASFLRRKGADPDSVRRLMAEDLETFNRIAEVVRSAVFKENGVVFARAADTDPGARLVAAKAADRLLNLSGINASFVFSVDARGVTISARSNGSINVQVVMEYLDGGGHMTQAGVRLEGMPVELAEMRVTEALKQESRQEGKDR